MTPGKAKRSQEEPREARMRPRWGQTGAKKANREAKRGQDGAKMEPR